MLLLLSLQAKVELLKALPLLLQVWRWKKSLQQAGLLRLVLQAAASPVLMCVLGQMWREAWQAGGRYLH